MVREIKHLNEILCIIIEANYQSNGIEFFTPPDFSQQLGYMNHGKGHTIPPHTHNPMPRKVILTQEVLYVKKGKVRVDLYDKNQVYVESTILKTGDVILLASGGHGFEMLENTEMIEIKQGPYLEQEDKVRFKPVDSSSVTIK
ncbi:MAG: hypothetical protein JKY53_10030 [Flavobacteriales bacterium]|nr:hypothetical protein [Flavobacteriales bacterium]